MEIYLISIGIMTGFSGGFLFALYWVNWVDKTIDESIKKHFPQPPNE